MDPASLTAEASIGSTLISGGVSAAGAGGSASASSQSFQYKAGIAQLNSQIAKQNAAWATNAGGIKAANFGMKAGQEIASTKVAQAASGLDVNSGSAAAVRSSQSDIAKYDQATIRSDAAHQAHGYEVESAKDTAEAQMDLSAAKQAEEAGKFNILSSILGTGTSVASKWLQGSTLGIGSSSSSVGTFSNGGMDGMAPSWST